MTEGTTSSLKKFGGELMQYALSLSYSGMEQTIATPST